MTAPQNRLKLILVLLALTPLLLLLVGILVIALATSRFPDELDALRESIRREGYPITAEELNEWYSPGSRSEEAGLAFTELISSYNFDLDENEELLIFNAKPDIREPLSSDQIELALRHIQNNANYLGDLHKLIDEYESVRYPVDFSDGMEAELLHLAPVRTMTRMMALEALVAANAGYQAEMIDALVGTFRVADTLHAEPTVLSQLVRIACLKIAFDASEQAINRMDLTVANLDKLQRTVDAIDCDGITRFGMVGERCLVNSTVERYGYALLNEGASPFTALEPLMNLPGVRRYMDWELLHILEAYTELMSAGEEEPFERREYALRIQHELEESQRFGSYLANTMVPSLVRAYNAEIRTQAYLDALSLGLASLQFSHDRGRMPSELAELVPEYVAEIPTDPFSGGPLRLRSDESGYVVYSFGHDLDDDGGNPPPEDVSLLDDGDIVFRVLLKR